MIELLWKALAWLLSREPIADYLIRRSWRTPYTDIASAVDPADVYMRRWWLFNPYDGHDTGGTYTARVKWCPISIRIHHILRPDQDRHLHDHPWNARTIVLMGGYFEERPGRALHHRGKGATASLRFGEFHRITSVDPTHGAVTLFITGKYRGTWGFQVDGRKVPYREYLSAKP